LEWFFIPADILKTSEVFVVGATPKA